MKPIEEKLTWWIDEKIEQTEIIVTEKVDYQMKHNWNNRRIKRNQQKNT